MTKQAASPLDRAIAMVADLRLRCDWDRIQTRHTLRPYLIEEAHELAAALGAGDPVAIREEVADLMLHLAWQLVLGLELGEFTPDQIADDLIVKMTRRHPHLFGLGERRDWEELKSREHADDPKRLGNIPDTLPQLHRARLLQQRAARFNFDWPDWNGPLVKVNEELAEVEAELSDNAPTPERVEEEIGDLLFAVVNLARKAGVSPEQALERANVKFCRRFDALASAAAEAGIDPAQATLAQLDTIWDEVKRYE